VEQLVDAFEASGLRRREFCQQHGVAVGTLDVWRKRRRRERGTYAGKRLGAGKVHVGADVRSDGRLVAVGNSGNAGKRKTGRCPAARTASGSFRGVLMRRRWSVCWVYWIACRPCLDWEAATRIYLAVGATDMRKGFNGLFGLVRDRLQCEPLSGHVFLFCNGQRNRLKLVFWDGSGLWVCAKRLEKGKFRWPESEWRSEQSTAKPRRVGAVAGRDRSAANETPAVVPTGVTEEPRHKVVTENLRSAAKSDCIVVIVVLSSKLS